MMISYATVLERLRLWRETALAQLAESRDVLPLKLELDAAITLLELCERVQLHPRDRVTVLPELRTRSPSSVYRVAEDNETDDRAHWRVLDLELSSGDVIIARTRHRR
jgi:hypothetical protein